MDILHPIKHMHERAVNKRVDRITDYLLLELGVKYEEEAGPYSIPVGHRPHSIERKAYLGRIGASFTEKSVGTPLEGRVIYDVDASEQATEEVEVIDDHMMNFDLEDAVTVVFRQAA